MKRRAGLSAVLMVLMCAMIISGCGQKQETPKPVAPSVNMQEGSWEITTMIEMQGMPSGMMKPQTHTTCLSQKEYVPKAKEQQPDCTVQESKMDGNTAMWTVVCKEATSKGKITYAGTSFDGVTETSMKQGGKDMNVKTSMKGKYLGPCQK